MIMQPLQMTLHVLTLYTHGGGSAAGHSDK